MKKLLFRTINLIKKGEYSWIPSSLAFYLLLSIIPLLLVIVIVATKYLSVNIENILSFSQDTQLHKMIIEFIQDTNGSFSNFSLIATSIVLLYTIWLSSRGLYGLSNAAESLFGFKKINYVFKRLYAYITTIILVIVILAMILFAGIVPLVLKSLHIEISFIYSYFIILVILYFVIHLIYLLVSQFRLKNKEVFKGSLFATLTIYFLLIFSNIIFYQSNMNVLFGSFAIVLLLTQFFFYVSFCLYIGLLINYANKEIETEEVKNEQQT